MSTSKPLADRRSEASDSLRPSTSGTETCSASVATVMVTVEPAAASVPPRGSCATTVPAGPPPSLSATSTPKPAERSSAAAALSSCPTTEGTTSVCWPRDTTSVTPDPRSTCSPGPGCVSTTRPAATSAEKTRSSSTSNPASSSVSTASSRGSPITSGIATLPGPADTVRLIVDPSGASAPAAGSCPTTRPAGSGLRARVTSTSKPSLRRRCWATWRSAPTTSGTATSSGPPSSSSAAMTAPATSRPASAAHSQRRRLGPSGSVTCCSHSSETTTGGGRKLEVSPPGAPVSCARTASSAPMNSSASWKRLAGAFSSARMVTASRSGGRSARNPDSGGGASLTCLSAMVTALSASKGSRPASIS
jgi:hypothetical protein